MLNLKDLMSHKQLKCGNCGGEDHRIFLAPDNSLKAQCVNKECMSVTSMLPPKAPPKIRLIPWDKSIGTLTTFE